jgi:aminopeptidase-like protein
MREIIETLYPMNRCLLGAGYDNALKFIEHLVKLDVIEIPSGTEVGTWTVPNEWVIREAWVKNSKGEKIIDYSKDLMSLMVGAYPVNQKMKREELIKHLHYSEEMPDAIPYTYNLYGTEWGFNVKKSEFLVKNDEEISSLKLEGGKEFIPKYAWNIPEDEYEVFIDSENKPGVLKIGVHTIKGKSDREILLFAHLDHPFQANDNLSAVACLLDLANKIKAEHTIKIIFCPETIG